MATIVCLERDSLGTQFTLPPLKGDHQWRDYPSTAPEQVTARLRDADVAVVNKVVLNADVLSQLPKLKYIAVSATGVNNVDLIAASRLGIQVSNIQRYSGPSVAEHTFMLLLALRRSLLEYRREQRAGHWQSCGQFFYADYPIDNLQGQTIGLIGSGDLGQHVAQIAKGFGMHVKFAARPGQVANAGKDPFEDILRNSDVISIHCPLTDTTQNLIDTAQFAMMKPTAILLNTARGGIVNEQALLEAIERQQIAGAGFDVSEQEPPQADSPLMRAGEYPNCIVTPHIAWASQQSRQVLIDQLMDNIRAFLEEHPKHLVN
ncbi:D-2-hydroxyacid dehydrogenase [Celerinatantimonas yamalensis]|uniref:D-2-hydroxyacid dehydrogenase n=1 Tax=Celerinatantimonas yamalensis TaxID=559956 RepID=A0ABW9GB09_9GAMM